MLSKFKTCLPVIALALVAGSCKKGPDTGFLSTGNFTTDTTGPLKSATGMPIGLAIENNLYMNNAAYRATVNREASSVTFGNELKYGSVVQNDGSFNFATADALFNAVSSAGITVFGHVLGWHQQQNGTYLKSYAGITIPAATELLPSNGGFESGTSGWSIFNTNGATVSFVTGDASNAHTGNGYMKVVNPTAQTGNQWKVQVSSAAFATTPGKQYNISYWVKAASAGGSIRLSSGPTAAQYQGDQTIGTAWQQVNWTITANLSSTTFLFDMGQVANTYSIDDVSVKEVVTAPSQTQVAARLDTALNKWITAAVTRYAGKIKAWDVVNELFAEDGNLRNNNNTSTTDNNTLVWSNYLGREYAVKAFNYAKAADPAALLFINDYNLESSTAKLDSLVAYVKELQGRGVKIDGIGTQMHTGINASYNAIDNMFKKLAATGLKVRISELDVRLNPLNKSEYPAVDVPATIYASQADMYKYIVNSYMKNVPAAQQYGITVWGVDDATSWIITSQKKVDYPLLFDKNFVKKPAYAAVLQALRGQ